MAKCRGNDHGRKEAGAGGDRSRFLNRDCTKRAIPVPRRNARPCSFLARLLQHALASH